MQSHQLPATFVVLCFCAVTSPAPASANGGNRLHLGAQFAYVSAWHHLGEDFREDSLKSQFRRGLDVGGTVLWDTGKRIGWTGAVIRSLRGDVFDGLVHGDATHTELRVDVIALRSAARMRLLRAASGPFVELGPEISFVTGAEERLSYTDRSTGRTNHEIRDLEHVFNPVDLGLWFAAGTELRLAAVTGTIEVGLTFSVLNRIRNQITDAAEDPGLQDFRVFRSRSAFVAIGLAR